MVFSILTHYYSIAASDIEDKLKGINSELKMQVTIDPLTKILNRRSILERISKEVVCCERYGNPLSLVMADIDNFKSINDRYGHECGDIVLITVSEIINKVLRKCDSLARWGGEEFLIVLTGTRLEAGEMAAMRIREAVEGESCFYKGHHIQVTLTLGVSTYSIGKDISDCINDADKAMYEGKQRGKNCVVVANY